MIDLFWMILCEQMCRHHIQYCNTWYRVPHLWYTHMYECAIIPMFLMRLQTLVLVRCCSIYLPPKSHGVLTSLSLSFHFTACLFAFTPLLLQDVDCTLLAPLTPIYQLLFFTPLCLALSFTLLVHDYVNHTLPAE